MSRAWRPHRTTVHPLTGPVVYTACCSRSEATATADATPSPDQAPRAPVPLWCRGPSRLAGWLESPPARGGLLVTCYLLLFSGKACGKSMGHEVRLDLVEHHAGNTCVRARGLAGKKVHQGARHPWVAGMERNGPSPCGTSPEYGIPGTSHPRARAPSDCADLRCSGRFVAPSSGSTVSGQRHLHKRKSRTNTDEQL